MEIETEIEMAMTIIRNRKIERKKKGKEERRKSLILASLVSKWALFFHVNCYRKNVAENGVRALSATIFRWQFT